MGFCTKCGNQIAEDSSFCANCGAKAFQSTPQIAPQRTLQPTFNEYSAQGAPIPTPNNVIFRAKYNKSEMTKYVVIIIIFILGGFLSNWFIDKTIDEIKDTPRLYMSDEKKEENIEFNEDLKFFSNLFDIVLIAGFVWNCVRLKGNYLEITETSLRGTSFQTFGFTNVDFSVNINDLRDWKVKGNTLVLKTAFGNYVCMIENNYQASNIIRNIKQPILSKNNFTN